MAVPTPHHLYLTSLNFCLSLGLPQNSNITNYAAALRSSGRVVEADDALAVLPDCTVRCYETDGIAMSQVRV